MERILVGSKEIAAALRCERRRVRALIAAGAPIRRVSTGRGSRYIASLEELIAWVRLRRS